MRLCVNSKAMQVKVQREKESHNRTIVTKVEQWKKIVTLGLILAETVILTPLSYTCWREYWTTGLWNKGYGDNFNSSNAAVPLVSIAPFQWPDLYEDEFENKSSRSPLSKDYDIDTKALD